MKAENTNIIDIIDNISGIMVGICLIVTGIYAFLNKDFYYVWIILPGISNILRGIN